jgi:hypothetical protein
MAETVHTEKPSGVIIRGFSRGEESLLLEVLNDAVYTFSYLDSLAPGALLYLKTGGKVEAEYLQLARM